MINVTRLDGKTFFINAEKIKTVEQTPDTLITLTTGEKFIVRETTQQIVEKLIRYQQQIHQEKPLITREVF